MVYCMTEPGMALGLVVPFTGSEKAWTDLTTVRLGSSRTVTVFAQLLLASSISAIAAAGSALHAPPLFGLTSEPPAVGVTVTGTLNEAGITRPPAVAPAYTAAKVN